MKKTTTVIGIMLLIIIAAAACVPANSTSGASTATAASSSNPTKLNLNTATADEFLAGVPGLGNRMVREFMEYRPYVSIQQFRREIGKYVDDAQVAEYEKYVFVPIAINDSDSETLQQIPGLSAEEAASLIAARPFASTDDFLTALSQYVSAEELEVAKTYLGDN
jgi:DNA uptake protein ComE-like DNA-binding protein